MAITQRQTRIAYKVRNLCVVISILAVAGSAIAGLGVRFIIATPALVFALGIAVFLFVAIAEALRSGVLVLTVGAVTRESQPVLYWALMAVLSCLPLVVFAAVGALVYVGAIRPGAV